jgi:hypothetical protein
MWERFYSWWWGKAPGGEIVAEALDADLIMKDAINRSVLVVRAAEPFKRWAARTSGQRLKETREALSADHTAYLIPREDSREVDPEVLEAIYAEIFERELLSWHSDRTQWPAPRTLAMFREWFELDTCTLAVDLIDGPIERDEG